MPLNPQYRNPPPGSNPPEAYDDPVTVPAGDIADNAYFKRDARRAYPRLSVVQQPDVVGLLALGNKTNPKDVLQIGDAGKKQLAEVKSQGEETGLAAYFEKEKGAAAGILSANGLPPLPVGLRQDTSTGAQAYEMDIDRTQGFPEE